MDFRLTDEQRLVRDNARDFVDRELIPHVREWEEKGEIPKSFYRKMAGLGFLGAPVPEKYGGAGMDYVSFMLLVEEISRGSSSVRTTVSVQTSLSETSLMWFGSEAQKETWLVPLAKGERFGAWAITEPEAGSDAGNLATTARLDGNEWVLNGQKRFISNGSIADYIQVYAREPGTKRHEGISLFLVPKDAPGFKVTHVETTTKLGLRASPTADLAFEDCRIPKENLIGKKGDGWNQAMRSPDGPTGHGLGCPGARRIRIQRRLRRGAVFPRCTHPRTVRGHERDSEADHRGAYPWAFFEKVRGPTHGRLGPRLHLLQDRAPGGSREHCPRGSLDARVHGHPTDEPGPCARDPEGPCRVRRGPAARGRRADPGSGERNLPRHAHERHPVRGGELLPRERGGSWTGGVPCAPASDSAMARRWVRAPRPRRLWPHRGSHRARRFRGEDPHGAESLTGLKSVP